MATERQRQILLFYTAAVIPDPNQFDATLLYLHIDPVGTGVESIFNQFFYDRRGALHHLASSDLVREPRREQLNGGHVSGKPLDQDAGIRMVCPTITRSSRKPLNCISSLTVVWFLRATPDSVSPRWIR